MNNRMQFLENRKDLRGDEEKYRLILTEEEIQKCVQKCADIINTKFQGKEIVLTCILKGAVYFFVDLSRKLIIPHSCYFIEASSYKNSQTQSEEIEILSLINPSKFNEKYVILIDELFDNGNTIEYVKRSIHDKANVPIEMIYTCTIFKKNKKSHLPGTASSNLTSFGELRSHEYAAFIERNVPHCQRQPDPDLYGILVPDVWLVGYGLDNLQEKRGWTHLYACPKEINIPKSKDDIIFEDDNAYKEMREKLKSIIIYQCTA